MLGKNCYVSQRKNLGSYRVLHDDAISNIERFTELINIQALRENSEKTCIVVQIELK
jgi:hypothetical protein